VNDRSIGLVRAAVKGDPSSYEALVKDYSGLIYTMAFRMTGDHHLAEDLCQEIFTKAWMNLKKLKTHEAFPGWIVAIGRRACLNAIEKRRRKKEVAEDEAEPARVNPVMPRCFDASRVLLEEAMARLSLQDRELITLSYFKELSSAEVAELMGLEPGTVRVYLMRAREKLKKMLEGREHELLER
jgi:RNA polymerase sigma-70 factor (ECF subfamily)